MDELRWALELATEAELEQLTAILFTRRFNPLDYWQTPAPLEVQSQERDSWLDSLEKRFRFLAADSLTVLKGRTQQFTYRQTLIQVCQYLKIPYGHSLATTEIEAEIFLHLLGKAWSSLPPKQQKSLTQTMEETLTAASIKESLAATPHSNPLTMLLKRGGILAANSLLKSLLLKQIARQFAYHLATYQAAKATLVRGGAIAASQLQNYLALQTAQKGMALTAARYGTVKTVFAFLGPVLWSCLLAELGWQAIATNYSRIIPVIFTLAQIRLTRSEPWEWETV